MSDEDKALVQRLRSNRPIPTLPNEAADRIEQLEREKAVVSDLWGQQKEIALDYLADCNKAAERIEALEAEVEQWKVDYNELLLEGTKLRAALKNHLYTGKGWRSFKETYEALREKNDD